MKNNNGMQTMKMFSISKKAIYAFWPLVLIFTCFLFTNGLTQERPVTNVGDSLFQKLSIDELIEIKKYFDGKIERARQEEEGFRFEGMKISEDFLGEKGMKIKDRDRVYIRLAEYYIEETERNYDDEVAIYEEEYELYEQQLALFDRGELTEEPPQPQFPKYDYSRAIEIYNRILDEYPAGDFADDALYSKAWLLDKMGRGEESRRIYQEVIDKYPDSHFAPESYIQLAEYFFSPRDDKITEDDVFVELQKAIQLYQKVLRYRDSKRYTEALYKLGWSYYKLAARETKYYDDAISYFLLAADDITRAKDLDPMGKISNPNVKDEAITYIGISFTDELYTTRGVDMARRLIRRIGDRPYGSEIMRAIGQTYQKIDENDKAIYAYENLLEMYPYYRYAPQIQQNIVESLFNLGRDNDSYNARMALFENYGPNSGWFRNMDASDEPDKIQNLAAARRLSEQAQRTNIILDLEEAEELTTKRLPSVAAYEKVIDGSLKYLNTFPTDSNAYEIHWSYAFLLDSRLSRFEDAFNEYIKVSNDYFEDTHQHRAALNAVFVADTLVKIKYGVLTDTSLGLSLVDIAQLSPQALTSEETRLIEAYDNYIRLFPMGEYTPNFLAAAGGIYYNHRKFAEAKVYFQTLVRRFPQAEQRNLALRSIMDSYFALGKFKDSEIVAKRIMNTADVSEEQKEFAARRLGQAIFKNAESLEGQGQFFDAGAEYLRVYQEAPYDDRLSERALFNSGLNYAKAKDWLRSIESHNILATEFPKSQFAIPALEKAAESYVELEQYDNAAQSYKRVFTNYRDSDNAEPALYNASFYFRRAENWQEAINTNNTYIAAYPDRGFATDLFFSNASLYLKLDNFVEANRIYEEFARQFPDDPRAVEAYYERGKYFMDNGQTERAKSEFNLAIRKSETFLREGKDPNAFVAGEAVNALAELLHRDYMAIELKQPASNLEAQKTRLTNTLRELNQTYTKVISFGSPRSFEATYNIARSFEEFASKYAEQEIEPSLDINRRFVEQKAVNDQSAALYEKAFEEYKTVVQNIPIIAERLGVDMFGEEVKDESLLAIQDSLRLARVTERDSTRDLAIKWYEKAKDKISEMLYTQASLTTENVSQAVNIQPVGRTRLQRLSYKYQVLMRVASPAIQQTIDAHIRNINEAEASGLSNKYVEESKRQILLTSNILAQELEKLVYFALDDFEAIIKGDLPDLIEKGYDATNNEGLNYFGLDEDANQLLDYSREISKTAIDSYSNTLKMAKKFMIQSDLINNTQDRLLRFAVEVSDKMDVLADFVTERSAFYRTRFDSTGNYDYDDGSTMYQNYFYNFQDSKMAVLETAFDVKEEHDISNLWANKLLLKLIRLNPERYAGNIEKERITIISDNTWKFSNIYYPEQWTLLDFDDSTWEQVYSYDDYNNQFAQLGVNPNAIWAKPVEVADSMQSGFADEDTVQTDQTLLDQDSLQEMESVQEAASRTTVSTDSILFFRRKFELDGTPTQGMIYLTADDDFRLYLNGDYIIDDYENNFAVLDSVDFITLEFSLKSGMNIIAIDVEDKDFTGEGLKFYGFFEIIPADVTEAAERLARAEKITIDPKILQRVNILNKNRISLKP